MPLLNCASNLFFQELNEYLGFVVGYCSFLCWLLYIDLQSISLLRSLFRKQVENNGLCSKSRILKEGYASKVYSSSYC